MSDFIVLGLIPGTNIQIGLMAWAILSAGVILVFYVMRRMRRTQAVRFLFIRISMALAARRQTRA